MDVLGSTHPCSFSKKPSAIYSMQYKSPSIIQVKAPTNSFGSQAGYKAIIT